MSPKATLSVLLCVLWFQAVPEVAREFIWTRNIRLDNLVLGRYTATGPAKVRLMVLLVDPRSL